MPIDVITTIGRISFRPFEITTLAPIRAPMNPPTAMMIPISHTGRPAKIKNSKAAKLEVKFKILVRAVASTNPNWAIATKQMVYKAPAPGPKKPS